MPRVGLNKEKVIEKAVEIANREGLDAVTLKLIAQESGVKTPSLYKHIEDLDSLFAELACLGIQGLGQAIREALTRCEPGEDAIRQVARAYRRYALKNPGLYAAFQPTHVGRGEKIEATAKELIGLLGKTLAPFHLNEDETIHALRAFRALCHGFADLELKKGFGLAQDVDESFERLVLTFVRGLSRGE